MATKPYTPYSVEEQQLARRRSMAESLMQQMSSYQAPPSKGPISPKASPLNALVRGLGLYMTSKQLKDLDQEDSALGVRKAEAASAAEAAAKRTALVKLVAEQTGKRAKPESLRDGLMNEDPSMFQYHEQSLVPKMLGDKQYLEGLDEEGNPKPYFAPTGGTTVNVGGDKESLGFLADARKQLAAGREVLTPQVAGLLQSGELQSLVDRGLKTGGGQSAFQAVRKFGQAFGVEIPETGFTDAARGLLEQGVLARAKEVAPVTEKDLEGIRKAVGSIDTDPQALAYLNALNAALTYKKMLDHNNQVEQAAKYSNIPGSFDMYKAPLPAQMQLPALAGQMLQNWGIQLNTPEGPAKFNISPRPMAAKPVAASPVVTQSLPAGIRRVEKPK